MTDIIVVDNSALPPLFLVDEADDHARLILGQSADGEILVAPSLCLLEFGNCVLKAVRRGRLTEAEAATAHHEFALLPIDFREAPPASSLAGCRGLSFYDATYLASAINNEASLATLDKALKNAAQAEGVTLV